MKFNIIITILIGTWVISSCSVGKYIPPTKIAHRALKNFEYDKSISVINIQTDKTDYDLKYEGLVMNYYELTENIVEGLKSELKRIGIKSVNSENNKELKIRVSGFSISEAGVMHVVITGVLDTQIEMGNGEKENIKVVRASGYGRFQTKASRTKRVLNACYKAIIQQIMQNDEVQAYLRELN